MSNFRSKRNTIWEETRSLLDSAGYKTWRVFVRKEVVYIMLVIAINQLAYLTKRDPYRVYQVIYVIYRRLVRGAKFRPRRLSPVTLDVLSGEERDGVVRECCPRCGCDLGMEPGTGMRME